MQALHSEIKGLIANEKKARAALSKSGLKTKGQPNGKAKRITAKGTKASFAAAAKAVNLAKGAGKLARKITSKPLKKSNKEPKNSLSSLKSVKKTKTTRAAKKDTAIVRKLKKKTEAWRKVAKAEARLEKHMSRKSSP